MDERKALDTTAYIWLMVFCICTGLQSISLKATGGDVSPIMQIALRSTIGSVLLIIAMKWLREDISHWRSYWKAGLFSGLLFAFEYILIGEALRLTTAARVTVFMYTSPLSAALILPFFVTAERLSKWQWGGVLIAFGGIIAAFWESEATLMNEGGFSMLIGDFLALVSGLLWGVNTVIVRASGLKRAPVCMTSLFHIVPTFIVLYLSAMILGQFSVNLTAFAALNIGFQTLTVAFGGSLLWFWLLRTYMAARISVFSFLTPLFTIVFAFALLDEPVEPHFIVGAIMVVGGLMLTSLSKSIKT